MALDNRPDLCGTSEPTSVSRTVQAEESMSKMAPNNLGLSGLRLLACISIVLGHCFYWVGHSVEDGKIEAFYKLADVGWATATLNALEPAMDVFLVLTGFLAGISLIPALEATKRPLDVITKYYKKRAVRILPTYYGTLAIAYILLYPLRNSSWLNEETRSAFYTVIPFPDSCSKNLWANFFFAQNQYPMGGCMNYTWSLAVQVQFYLLCPAFLLLLMPSIKGFRTRICAACVLISAFVLHLRASILKDPRMHMPVPLLGPHTPRNDELILLIAENTYYTLTPRLNQLAYGIVGAVIFTDKQLMQKFSRHRRAVSYLLHLLLFSIAGGLAVNKMGPQPDDTHPLADPKLMFVGFVISLGVIQPATVTLLVLYLASAEKQVALPRKAADIWKAGIPWLADYTYDIFLLHPLIYMAVLNALPPSLWFEKAVRNPSVFFAIGTVTFIFSLGAAILHKNAWAQILKGVQGVPS